MGNILGCGGSGSGSGGGNSNPPQDFSISLSSTSLTIDTGGTAPLTVTATGANGFTSAVAIQITGLPTGVTYSPSNPQAIPGSPLQITFTSATTTAASSATLTLTGTSESLTHSTQLSLKISTASPATFVSRTRYTRTDAVTEYFTSPGANWMVFDSPTNRFFVSDPYSNRIEVLDAARESMIGTITVPGAYGIDEAPDHSVIYAGTQVGDVYAIDPVAMQVKKRYLSSQIGPTGYLAYSVRVLANGSLALLGSQGGIPSVDGFGSVAVWNPVSNAFSVYGTKPGGPSFCVNNIGTLTLTGDRSLIVVEGDGNLCTLNPTTGEQKSVQIGAAILYNESATPDGKSLLLSVYNGGKESIAVFSVQTLAQTSSFPVPVNPVYGIAMLASPDSQTLYLTGGPIVYAYNIATGTQIGWMPNLTVEPTGGGTGYSPAANPILEAFDNTGLMAGPMEEGVGFLDATTLQTGPVGIQLQNGYLTPATGPSGGGTQVTWTGPSLSGKLTAVFIGGNAATSISESSGKYEATMPAGAPGPADLYAQTSDGGMFMIPEAFSYGPTIVEVTPDSATADGGGTGVVFGYGLGPTAYNTPIPTDLQITVGGQPATVTQFAWSAYGIGSPPFLLQAAAFTIPPGGSGSSADVVVTTSSGSTTLKGAIQYLPAAQKINLTGESLAQGVYDPKRDVYYFTDAYAIRVYSRTQGTWLSPIAVPPVPSGAAHRLWGIALSPDGSKLAVSDAKAGLIYLIDPDSPSSIKSFSTPTYSGGHPISPTIVGVVTYPAGLAVSNSGTIYYTAFVDGGTGYDGFFKLDTNSGQITDYGEMTSISGQYRVALSPDNSRAFFNNDGDVFSVDTATDKVTHAAVDPGCCYGNYDLALSANNTTLAATGYLYDTSLNAQSFLVLNDRDKLVADSVNGMKLSPDGTLLFKPSLSSIDVFDARLGTLRTRISLPVILEQNFDALVSDGKDNVLIAITGNAGGGIAIIDLNSLTKPAPLPYATAQPSAQFADNTSIQGRP